MHPVIEHVKRALVEANYGTWQDPEWDHTVNVVNKSLFLTRIWIDVGLPGYVIVKPISPRTRTEIVAAGDPDLISKILTLVEACY